MMLMDISVIIFLIPKGIKLKPIPTIIKVFHLGCDLKWSGITISNRELRMHLF